MGKSNEFTLETAPKTCPITGLRLITGYTFNEGVVYAHAQAYDAYTLPDYDEEEKAFYRTRIDMDNDFIRHQEFVCELDDLKDRHNFNSIKEFYGI